ncbi:cation:proton antiporter [Microbacterium sp. GXF7504]
MSLGLLVVLVAAVLVIVFANTLSRRTGVAGPLILVAIGVGVSLLPGVPSLSVAPEVILMGVLPPLLFSAAVSAPAIEFRRDLTAISGLAVLLVIVSALVLGAFFAWAIPGLGYPLGVALGAILSPTDAVATTIVKKVGVSRRVVTVLEGESLLNDASALVILRTAIVAAASGFSFLTTLGSFAWSVFAAIVVGALAGLVALRLRAWASTATANTALGLTVPYLAYVPTELLGGSGLVAAVTAGVICGQGSVRWLTPEQRISDKLTWRTIEFVLEGAVFLIMGLELWGIVQKNIADDEGLGRGLWIAALAFVLLVVVRALYVFPMTALHTVRVRRAMARRVDRVDEGTRKAERLHTDRRYFEANPLTWRHSAVIVWAGMRGAVTLAAAQTLSDDTPERDLLIFIAFLVAAGSLLVQGLTLPAVVRMLGLRSSGGGGLPRDEVRRIDEALREAAQAAIADRSLLRRGGGAAFSDEVYALPVSRILVPFDAREESAGPEGLEFELALIAVMRARLHEVGRSGAYGTAALRYVMDELDAYELSVKLHLESEK